MSLFNDILEIKKHDGRPLWQYKLSEEAYQELKNAIADSKIRSIDQRAITLYFAEWWKNEYDGGAPSIQDIYDSLYSGIAELYRNCTPDELYQHAKQGATRLGIKWIQINNVLKLRTILLQGGLPIKNLLNVLMEMNII